MKILKASNIQELELIASLRYHVYYEECGKKHIEGYDHSRKALINSKDYKGAELLYAYNNEEVVGSLRCVYSGYNDHIRNKYGIPFIGKGIKYAEVDCFVIKKSHRKSRAALSLACDIYQRGIMNGVHICLIEVEAHLLRFYKRQGFRIIKKIDYEFGDRYQLCLNLWDIDLLRERNSPFIELLTNYHSLINIKKRINEKHHQVV